MPKKKVIIVDPWGINNTSEYLNGLIWGLSDLVDLEVFTNEFFILKTKSSVKIHKVFFKHSEQMKKGKLRKLIRFLEYIIGYFKIIQYLKSHSIDIVHFNWLLMYKLDIIFLRKIKKSTKKLVYTAHNVIPHVNGEKEKGRLSVIYGLCDCIIVHGESIKKEFSELFPLYISKIYVQKHGCNLFPKISFDEKKIDRNIIFKLSCYKKKILFFGSIFYNKGTDILVNKWNPEWRDALLIIAGKRNGSFSELDALSKKINNSENILYLDGFIDDDTLNFLLSQADLVFLPYRHASMSGVVFTAADFSVPICCTKTGALPEYINDGIDGFLVDNDEESISSVLKRVVQEISVQRLHVMGKKLHTNIYATCSWKDISFSLYKECYMENVIK